MLRQDTLLLGQWLIVEINKIAKNGAQNHTNPTSILFLTFGQSSEFFMRLYSGDFSLSGKPNANYRTCQLS